MEKIELTYKVALAVRSTTTLKEVRMFSTTYHLVEPR